MNPAEEAVYQDSFTVIFKSLVSTYHCVILWQETVHPEERNRAVWYQPFSWEEPADKSNF